MAAFRGISHCYERPTYADWPYSLFTMAHGRSKEECDAVLDAIAEATGITERATLYSSTEFKKIRLLYFTDAFRDWEREHAGLTASARPTRGRPSCTAARVRVLPGGVNSPVRAMRSIGRDPIFVERAAGAELIDVDGNRYVDYVCSWGPLIHGHAHPPILAAVAGGGGARHDVRRADRAPRSSWPRRSPPHAGGRDAAHDLVRDRGVDERDPARARGHRAREAPEVRRRLPRPRRRPARRGGLRPGHAGDPRQSPGVPEAATAARP